MPVSRMRALLDKGAAARSGGSQRSDIIADLKDIPFYDEEPISLWRKIVLTLSTICTILFVVKSMIIAIMAPGFLACIAMIIISACVGLATGVRFQKNIHRK